MVGRGGPDGTGTSRSESATDARQSLARRVFCAFLVTFIVARTLVLLIMSRAVPDLFVHVGGTHVHHLNYGIFLLAGVGAYLILQRPAGRSLGIAAIVYGIGLALTFDEFGMWLHLGGGYWQRASFDAVVVVAAVLGLIGVAPSFRRLRPRHWSTAAMLVIAVVAFGVFLARSVHYAERTIGPKLRQLDANAPP